MQQIPMQVATSIAHAWLTQVPLHQIALAARMDYVAVMNAIRQMGLPDRHPTTRAIYEGRSFVD
jgi:hypothetical protein